MFWAPSPLNGMVRGNHWDQLFLMVLGSGIMDSFFFYQTPGFMNSVQNTNLLVFWIVQSDIEHWYFEILPVTYHRQSLSEYTKAIHVFFPEFTRAISVYFPEYTRATVGCEDLLKSYLKAAGYFAGLIWQINFKSTFHLAVYYDMTNLAGLN